jgi:GGDEF domain-containing protein
MRISYIPQDTHRAIQDNLTDYDAAVHNPVEQEALGQRLRILVGGLATGQFARLVRVATRNPNTGLPNRAVFEDRVNEVLATEESGVGAISFDFVNFKPVNDKAGYKKGDDTLRETGSTIGDTHRDPESINDAILDKSVTAAIGEEEIAAIGNNLMSSIRNDSSNTRLADLVSHFGGDEFMIIAHEVNTPENLRKMATILAHRIVTSHTFMSITEELTNPSHGLGINGVGIRLGGTIIDNTIHKNPDDVIDATDPKKPESAIIELIARHNGTIFQYANATTGEVYSQLPDEYGRHSWVKTNEEFVREEWTNKR